MSHQQQPTDPSESTYFTHNPPPPKLQSHLRRAQSFISKHVQSGRRIALVTSGGTTVPLENQTVRFLDNFSAGTRGATSAEHFLSNGYAVIFLHREYSLLPYSRHYSHSTNCFLDFVSEDASSGAVVVSEEYQSKMKRVLRSYRKAMREDETLLLLDFWSVEEYLWYLREVARALAPVGSGAVFYLAAAVSDFFVPRNRLEEHKIQSSEEFSSISRRAHQDLNNTTTTSDSTPKPPDASTGVLPLTPHNPSSNPAAHMQDSRLIIDLDPVPKFLKQLVDGWAPSAMIVSFKLETDPDLLVKKARRALEKYAHHLVIGNLLATRKWEVVCVSPLFEDASAASGANGSDGDVGARSRGNATKELREEWIRVPRTKRLKSGSGKMDLVGASAGQSVETDQQLTAEEVASAIKEGEKEPRIEIEALIIPEVKRLHDAFIARKSGVGGGGGGGS